MAPEQKSWTKNDDKSGQHNVRNRRDAHDRHNKVDSHHLNPRYISSDDGTNNDDENTYVDDNNASKLTASSDTNKDNFSVVLGMPGKSAKKLKRDRAVAEKEVVAPCKCKPVAVTVLRKKKNLIQKSSIPTLMVMMTTSLWHATV